MIDPLLRLWLPKPEASMFDRTKPIHLSGVNCADLVTFRGMVVGYIHNWVDQGCVVDLSEAIPVGASKLATRQIVFTDRMWQHDLDWDVVKRQPAERIDKPTDPEFLKLVVTGAI